MDFMSLIKKGVATLNGKFPKRTKFDFRCESQAVLLTLLSRRPEKNSKLLISKFNTLDLNISHIYITKNTYINCDCQSRLAKSLHIVLKKSKNKQKSNIKFANCR